MEAKSSIPFRVIGTSRSSLIVETEKGPAFLHNKEVGYLMQHPDAHYEIISRPAHRGRRCPFGAEIEFPETKWVCVYKPTIAGFSI